MTELSSTARGAKVRDGQHGGRIVRKRLDQPGDPGPPGAGGECSVILLHRPLSIPIETPTKGRGGVQQNDSLAGGWGPPPAALGQRQQLDGTVRAGVLAEAGPEVVWVRDDRAVVVGCNNDTVGQVSWQALAGTVMRARPCRQVLHTHTLTLWMKADLVWGWKGAGV